MSLLIWTNKFPTYSETFIRDQIINLMDSNLKVLIFSGSIKDFSEKEALSGFEKYKLLDYVVDESNFIPKTWRKRKIKAFLILVFSLLKGHFKYYWNALETKKYGRNAQSFRLFYYVHFLLKNDIKIIHVHFGPNALNTIVFKEIGLPLKLFTTFHGYDIRLGIEEEDNFYRSLVENLDGVIAISTYNKKHLLNFGFDKRKIIDMPNGIDLDFYQKGSEKDDLDKICILSVARLVPEKGIHIAIEAFSKVLKLHPKLNIEFKIIGDGGQKEQLKVLIEELGITEKVKLAGVKTSKEVRDEMQRSDVFVLSSINEALPTVLLEAQACELPIVATNVGSIKEMVPEGIIVEPNSVDDFYNGLMAMLSNKETWIQRGRNSRNFVAEKFDSKIITKKLINIYNLET